MCFRVPVSEKVLARYRKAGTDIILYVFQIVPLEVLLSVGILGVVGFLKLY